MAASSVKKGVKVCRLMMVLIVIASIFTAMVPTALALSHIFGKTTITGPGGAIWCWSISWSLVNMHITLRERSSND
jgi:hypothetical protein